MSISKSEMDLAAAPALQDFVLSGSPVSDDLKAPVNNIANICFLSELISDHLTCTFAKWLFGNFVF